MEHRDLSKSLADAVVGFADLPPDPTGVAGGKGASLSRMAAAGLPVPRGFVVAAGAFREFLDSCGGSTLIAQLTNDLDVNDTRAVDRAAESIRTLIVSTPMPAPLAEAIVAAHAALNRSH